MCNCADSTALTNTRVAGPCNIFDENFSHPIIFTHVINLSVSTLRYRPLTLNCDQVINFIFSLRLKAALEMYFILI